MIEIERITQFGLELSELSNLFSKYRYLKEASFSKAAALLTEKSISLFITIIVTIEIERIG